MAGYKKKKNLITSSLDRSHSDSCVVNCVYIIKKKTGWDQTSLATSGLLDFAIQKHSSWWQQIGVIYGILAMTCSVCKR